MCTFITAMYHKIISATLPPPPPPWRDFQIKRTGVLIRPPPIKMYQNFVLWVWLEMLFTTIGTNSNTLSPVVIFFEKYKRRNRRNVLQ